MLPILEYWKALTISYLTRPDDTILYFSFFNISYPVMNDESYYYKGRSITLTGFICNAILFVIKLAAGIYGNSQALLADAVHTVSDLATDFVVLVGLKLSNLPKDENHPYGHEKIETLSTLVIGSILIYAALRIGFHAGKAIYLHQEHIPKIAALVVAAVSLITKEILYRYTIREGRRIKSESVIANAWHHRSDAFSSVAVLVGVGAAVIIPALHILDAYAALIVAFIIAKVGFEVALGAAGGLVDTAARREVRERIINVIRTVEEVRFVHDLYTRHFGRYILADVHIEVDPNISVFEGHNIATMVKDKVISTVPEVMNLLIHVEPAGDYMARHKK